MTIDSLSLAKPYKDLSYMYWYNTSKQTKADCERQKCYHIKPFNVLTKKMYKLRVLTSKSSPKLIVARLRTLKRNFDCNPVTN